MTAVAAGTLAHCPRTQEAFLKLRCFQDGCLLERVLLLELSAQIRAWSLGTPG